MRNKLILYSASCMAAMAVLSVANIHVWNTGPQAVQASAVFMPEEITVAGTASQSPVKVARSFRFLLPAPEKAPFEPLDIRLPVELQAHTLELCEQYDTPLPTEEFYDLVLRVMWHESGYIPDIRDNQNRNGTLDRGLMQINSVNWNWLAEQGLDVSVPEQNIEAGVMILSGLLNKYPKEYALACYALGEGGAKKNGGYSSFAVEILTMDPGVYLAQPQYL